MIKFITKYEDQITFSTRHIYIYETDCYNSVTLQIVCTFQYNCNV